jgi:hypothetical protein
MSDCKFPTAIAVGDGFKISLDVDQCEVESHTFCEIPVSGPGLANRLVTITGIAVPAADTTDDSAGGDIYIKTDYIVNSPDQWLNIVDGNTSLLQATTATLASIAVDEGEFILAIDEIAAQRNTDGRIQINIRAGIQGDSTLHRISYQANILISKGG